MPAATAAPNSPSPSIIGQRRRAARINPDKLGGAVNAGGAAAEASGAGSAALDAPFSGSDPFKKRFGSAGNIRDSPTADYCTIEIFSFSFAKRKRARRSSRLNVMAYRVGADARNNRDR